MSERDKEGRLATKADVGNRMRGFVNDPIIAKWFDDAVTKHTKRIIDADILDDDTRRKAAITVKILEEVRSFMQHADAEGRRSGEELAKRNKEKVTS